MFSALDIRWSRVLADVSHTHEATTANMQSAKVGLIKAAGRPTLNSM